MASSLSFSPVCSFSFTNNQVIFIGNSASGKAVRLNQLFQNTNKTPKFQTLEVKASEGTPAPAKVNSIVCQDCEGNGMQITEEHTAVFFSMMTEYETNITNIGAILCTQCKGEGVNITDHFNGQFKAGALCWLCRGKREILCGNCNGAGFVGGFMSTADS